MYYIVEFNNCAVDYVPDCWVDIDPNGSSTCYWPPSSVSKYRK